MCTLGDVFYSFCRPGQRDLDCRGFIQLCRESNLSSCNFSDTDAEKVFLKAMAVAKRRIDLPRFVDALRLIAEQKSLEEDAVHRMLISHCNRRPAPKLSRTESEPTFKRHEMLGEPEVEILDNSKRRHRRHLPSNRRRPKKLEAKDLAEPPSCQSTPGSMSLGTTELRSPDDSAGDRSGLFQMPSISPSQCMIRPDHEVVEPGHSPGSFPSGPRRSSQSNEPEPLPSPCGSTGPQLSPCSGLQPSPCNGVPPELKVVPPSPASVHTVSEPEPLPSPFPRHPQLDLKEPEPSPSPSRSSIRSDVKALEEQEGREAPELLTPNSSGSAQASPGTPGSGSKGSSQQRPSSPTSSAAVRGRLAQEETAASRHGIPTLALGECSKAKAVGESRAVGDAERLDGVGEAFAAFCGDQPGLDANGFVSFCKHSCLIDRNFTAQDARLVYAEAVPVSLQRMELRSFEVALGHVAAQKGLDRGHVRRMVAFPDAFATCHSSHSRPQAPAMAERPGAEQLLPLMPLAPPALDLQDPAWRLSSLARGRRDSNLQEAPPSRSMCRGTGKLRSLRRSETMPPSLSKERPWMAEVDVVPPVVPAVALPLGHDHAQDMEGPLAPVPPDTASVPSPLLAVPAPAPQSGENSHRPGMPSTQQERDDVALADSVPSARPSGRQEAGEAQVDSSCLPVPNVSSDQACHLMPLVCAR